MSLPQLLSFFEKDSNKDVYVATLEDDFEVLFCLPSVKDAIRYQNLLIYANGTSFGNIIIEHVFKEIVQDSWLKEAQDIPAGIPYTIVNLALYLSCRTDEFVDQTTELVNKYRTETNNILKYMKRKICSVFSAYTFEMCDKLDYPKLVEIFVEAEQILLENGIIEQPAQFTDGTKDKEQAVKSLHSQIRADQEAYRMFESTQVQNQKAEEFRRKQIERAKEEERRYNQQTNKR